MSHLPTPAREAVTDSLATGVAVLPGADYANVLAAARDAFAHGMQVTSLIAAILVLMAAAVAWKLIPSAPGR